MTEKQQKFLDALFGEAEGNPVKALKIAGYLQPLLIPVPRMTESFSGWF